MTDSSNLLAQEDDAAARGGDAEAAAAPEAETHGAEAEPAEAAAETGDEAGESPASQVPETPDGYELSFDHGLFEADSEVNEKLHELGLTNDQAQAVYDLAADKLVPLVESVAQEYEASRQRERLAEAFGGQERYSRVAKQIRDWAGKNMPEEAYDALARSYEGVMALYSMMQAGQEPSLGAAGSGGGQDGPPDTESLSRLMRDPRYWRDRDPAIVQQVTEGFRRLYPDS